MGGDRSFSIKAVAAILLTALADVFFYRQEPGTTLGVFALVLLAALALIHKPLRRDRRAQIAFALAAVFALVMVDRPSPLAALFWWLALAIGCLSARSPARQDAAQWALRLAWGGLVGLIGPVLDLLKGRLSLPRGGMVRAFGMVALPLVGGLIFLALFSMANPLIDQALSQMRLPRLEPGRLVFWAACLLLLWMALRPRVLRWKRARKQAVAPVELPGISLASVGLSLLVFNALFAVQNGLDIAFLWSGAPLPARVTLSDYAHRGANALIVTALLAGLFVLVALRPGSKTAASPWLRRLVVLWVAQTLVLVASSVLRTLDYIEAYSLTGLRIAALLWMGLVAAGLLLICWRLLKARSASWLINANVLCAGLVLAGCSAVDLNAVAAGWNVTHAREVGGSGAALDVCYLNQAGDEALVPVSRMLTRPLPDELRQRLAHVRIGRLEQLSERQSQWRGWTWRGQRRLEAALRILPADDPRGLTAWKGACNSFVQPALGQSG